MPPKNLCKANILSWRSPSRRSAVEGLPGLKSILKERGGTIRACRLGGPTEKKRLSVKQITAVLLCI